MQKKQNVSKQKLVLKKENLVKLNDVTLNLVKGGGWIFSLATKCYSREEAC